MNHTNQAPTLCAIRRGVLALTLAIFNVRAPEAEAAAFFWTSGGQSFSWSEGANWSGGIVPVMDGTSDLFFGAFGGPTLMIADTPSVSLFYRNIFQTPYRLTGGQVHKLWFLPTAGSYDLYSADAPNDGFYSAMFIGAGGIVNQSQNLQVFDTEIYYNIVIGTTIDASSGPLRFNSDLTHIGDGSAGITFTGSKAISFRNDTGFAGVIRKTGSGSLVFEKGLGAGGRYGDDVSALRISGGSVSITGQMLPPGATALGSSVDALVITSNSAISLSGGAKLVVSYGDIGVQINSGSASVSGADSSLISKRDIYFPRPGALGFTTVGNNGTGALTLSSQASGIFDVLGVGGSGSGQMMVQSGSTVSSLRTSIGADVGATGLVTVTGVNSVWNNSGNVFVGGTELGSGGLGTLRIQNSGAVQTGFLKVFNTSSVEVDNGSLVSPGLTILGGAAELGTNTITGGNLVVGQTTIGRMIVFNGGKVGDGAGLIGNSAGSTGSAVVTDPGSKWSNTGDLVVGTAGTGAVEVRAGGELSSLRGHVGFHPGAVGTVIVSDPGSRWVASGSHFIGNAGTGTLEVRNGGFASTAGHGYLGVTASSSMGTALVSGAGSIWGITQNLFIGGNAAAPGGQGVLHIEDGGVVSAATATVYNSGFLRLGASPTFNGPLTFLGGYIQTSASNTFNNSFSLGAGGVLVQTTGFELTLSGDISGPGGLTKFFFGGAGTLWLTGSNTYAGATTVDGGRLMVNGSITSATTVNTGGTLGGTGTTGSVTINSGGVMAPGTSIGTLTVNGNYTQTGAGALAIELGGLTPGTEFDQLSVSGQATVGGTLNLSLVNGFLPAVGDTFAIITSSSETGNFSTIISSGFTVRSDASDAGIVLTVTGLDPVTVPETVDLRSLSITPTSNDVVITYEATGGRTYRLERNLGLSATAWDAIPGVSDQTPTADGPVEITDPGGANLTRAFYRVCLLP